MVPSRSHRPCLAGATAVALVAVLAVVAPGCGRGVSEPPTGDGATASSAGPVAGEGPTTSSPDGDTPADETTSTDVPAPDGTAPDSTGTDGATTTISPDEAEPRPPGDLGDDAELDALAQDCFDGDFAACDRLFFDSPADSPYEAYGDSCGGRNEPGRLCVDIYGQG